MPSSESRTDGGSGNTPRVAYFCMEYGLSEKFPIYSGGLGVLAGDYVKSAGDLGLPVVAVGLRWACGTTQRVNAEGAPFDEWVHYVDEFVEDTGVRVRVRVRSKEIECRVCRVTQFVTVPLFLIEPVHKEDQWITERLYDSRPDCRLAQEMLLGIGGMRALPRLGVPVDIYHFNEGHAVFAGIEMIADRMANNVTFQEAWDEARRKIVFTTHTPVPAGNETHPLSELRRLGACLELVDSEILAIGGGDPFSMTVAGLRLAHRANAVAQLHGDTARDMWKDVEGAAPILGITNGVHRATWQAKEIAEAAAQPERLWNVHVALKQKLVERVHAMNGVHLDPNALTIGFARRAATYKRMDLILSQPDRLRPLLENRKVQILFSGKAHPADHHGKDLVKRIVGFSREWPDAVVFLENYDMNIAATLVQGCDIWLNNPRRPQEASGTSGMKAALNGVLNVSILDGWWPEGCVHGETGWSFGNGGSDKDQDQSDAEALFNTLENEVLSTFENRERWVRMMQASIRMAEEKFTSARMVREYYDRLYSSEESAEG